MNPIIDRPYNPVGIRDYLCSMVARVTLPLPLVFVCSLRTCFSIRIESFLYRLSLCIVFPRRVIQL